MNSFCGSLGLCLVPRRPSRYFLFELEWAPFYASYTCFLALGTVPSSQRPGALAIHTNMTESLSFAPVFLRHSPFRLCPCGLDHPTPLSHRRREECHGSQRRSIFDASFVDAPPRWHFCGGSTHHRARCGNRA